jgi:hypothetical protein
VSRVERVWTLLAYMDGPSFFAVGRALWEHIIKRSGAASSGRWPMVHFQRPTTARVTGQGADEIARNDPPIGENLEIWPTPNFC